jgi:hypothetical protein
MAHHDPVCSLRVDMTKISFECACGEVFQWVSHRDAGDDGHLACENCGAEYALSFTRFVDRNSYS